MRLAIGTTVEQLIEQSYTLESIPARWQSIEGPAPTLDEIDVLRKMYLAWYAACLRVLPDGQPRADFVDEYKGSKLSQDVVSFLAEPLRPNVFVKWQHPYERCFQRKIVAQRQLMMELGAIGTDGSNGVIFDELESIFRRFPQFLAALQAGARTNVQVSIANEYDLQAAMAAILRLHYDDVRREEHVPSVAGSNSRVDFFLRESGVMVEAKMTRRGLRDHEIGNELLVDRARYQEHPACQAMFAFVYDPETRLSNPGGLEHDFRVARSVLPCRIVIATG